MGWALFFFLEIVGAVVVLVVLVVKAVVVGVEAVGGRCEEMGLGLVLAISDVGSEDGWSGKVVVLSRGEQRGWICGLPGQEELRKG